MIIQSLLDTDLYKFTMMQAIFHRRPGTTARYAFRDRTGAGLAPLAAEVRAEIANLRTLRFSRGELNYLRSLRFIKADFVDFLEGFRLNPDYVKVGTSGDDLTIEVAGPMLQVMPFEIYILSIVNELHFRRLGNKEVRLAEARTRLSAKIATLKEGVPARRAPFVFFEFGTRRRYSREWQEEMVATLKAEASDWFKGTSNVRLARHYGLVPIGTMAHEYLQAFQAMPGVRLRDSQKAAFEDWAQEYRGDLGIALTDVIGLDAFLADFDLYFCKLFDGVRHDSGNPVEWGERILAHYEANRVDSLGKTLVFSDGLTVAKALDLHGRFGDRAKTGFGIGTSLSNDTGIPALNIVVKMTECNDQPVAKLSDSPGKTMCRDEDYLAWLRRTFAAPA